MVRSNPCCIYVSFPSSDPTRRKLAFESRLAELGKAAGGDPGKESDFPMNYQSYSNDIDKYELPQGFSLRRAINKDFVKTWVVYRQVNEDFSQSFAETQTELEGVKFCFWIEKNKRRVGGVIMLPNGIGDFFLIPPEQDANKILSVVIPLLEHWSDNNKAIVAQAIASPYVEAFQQAGFVLRESRAWMIRPTETLEASWSSEWEVLPLDPDQAPVIADLLKEAFAGGVGQYGERDFEAHLASVKGFFQGYTPDSDCGRASALVVQKERSLLAGVCMVELHKRLPTVRFVAVAPRYQKRGLASNLLRRAISILSPNYDWVKLAVSEANPAVKVYRSLGFIPGDPLHEMVKPALQ